MHVYIRSSCTMFVKPKESLRYSIHTHQSQHIPAEGNQERVNGRNDPSQILMACIYLCKTQTMPLSLQLNHTNLPKRPDSNRWGVEERRLWLHW